MSIYEYDEERHMRQTRAEGYEAGEMIATARINQLNLILIEQNRTSDIAKCIFRKNCASVPEERSAIPLQTEQSSAG